MAKKGKKYQAALAMINPEMEYSLEEACDLVKKTSTTGFDASVDTLASFLCSSSSFLSASANAFTISSTNPI